MAALDFADEALSGIRGHAFAAVQEAHADEVLGDLTVRVPRFSGFTACSVLLSRADEEVTIRLGRNY